MNIPEDELQEFVASRRAEKRWARVGWAILILILVGIAAWIAYDEIYDPFPAAPCDPWSMECDEPLSPSYPQEVY